MALAPLTFTVDANIAPFIAKMGTVTATVSGAASKMGTAFVGASNKLGAMVTKIGLIGGILGGVAVKSAAGFEKSMALAKTQTDATKETFDEFSQGLRAAAAEFGQTDLATVGAAAFDALSTGAKDTGEALDILKVSMEANAGSGIELATATKFVTQQWKVFQPAVRDARAELDRLAATTRVGSGTAQEFASAFTNVSAQAAAFGITQDELSSIMADLSTAMGGPTKAGTAIQQMLTALETPTKRQTDAIAALNQITIEQAGVNEFSVKTFGSVAAAVEASGGALIDFSKAGVAAAGGIQPFLAQLTRQTNLAQESGTNIRGMIRSVEGWNGLMVLAQDQAQGFGDKLEFIADASGGVAENAATMSETFDQKMRVMIASLKEFGLTLVTDTGFMNDLGEIVKNGTETIIEWTKSLVDTIKANPELVKEWKDNIITVGKWLIGIKAATFAISALAGVFGLLKLPFALMGTKIAGNITAWGLMKKALGFVGVAIRGLIAATGPWGLLIAAIGLLIGWLATLDIDWGKTFSSMIDWVFNIAEAIGEWIAGVATDFADFSVMIFDAITVAFGSAFDWVKDQWRELVDFLTALNPFSDDFLNFGGGGSAPGGGTQQFSKGGAVQNFALGGQVTGPAGLDVIPAKLTSGEFVINPVASRMLGKEMLEALNRMGQGGTSNAPFLENLTINATAGGVVDEQMIREILLPELERLQERSLSPRARSIR